MCMRMMHQRGCRPRAVPAVNLVYATKAPSYDSLKERVESLSLLT